MSDVDSTDAKFAMLNKQIGKKFYTDGYRPTLDDASVLLGGATMLAGLFQAERDRLRAVVRRAQEAWTRHVENYGDDDAFNEWTAAWDALRALDGSADMGGSPTEHVMTGHRPFSELSDGLRRRLADRNAERERIWAAIQAWTEIAHRLNDEGRPVGVEGTEFQPLAPFFDELRAMVFPHEDRDQSITCPKCGKTSHNQNDITNGYCGNCNDWTSTPRNGLPGELAIGTPVVVTHPDSRYTGLRGTVAAAYTDNPAALASGCPIFDVELGDGSMIIIPANAVEEVPP